MCRKLTHETRVQAEIHTINEDTADDVRSWQANAQSVQDDIIRSKTLANEILKQSEAPAKPEKSVDEIEGKAAFLVHELNYNQQVLETLRGVKKVNQILDQVEQARGERRILDALRLLEGIIIPPGLAPFTRSAAYHSQNRQRRSPL